MALTNAYSTLAQLRDELGYKPAETADDTKLELSINAASRQFDGYCGQRFWQDPTVAVYEFYPESATTVRVDDPEYLLGGISTLTGLIVKVDIDLDGTFESTLLINTDFQPRPRNALLMVPAHPYTELEIVPVGSQAFFPRAMYGRASVQITAKMGWPAVPDDVTKACLIQAAQLFKANQAVFGGVALGDAGAAMYVRSSINPLAAALLAPYRKPAVG